jgi:osmotically-inducible protein OsmY
MRTDAQVTRDVVDALLWEPTVTSDAISVVTLDGVVTLSGSVPSLAERHTASRIARGVIGVKAVAEELGINKFETRRHADAQTAAMIVQAFQRRVWIPDSVQATVENGRVILTGQVSWNFQRRSAESAANALLGVSWVTNSITLRRVSVTGALGNLLQRILGHETRDEVQGEAKPPEQQVYLAGYYQSRREREEFGWAPWHARERRHRKPNQPSAPRPDEISSSAAQERPPK